VDNGGCNGERNFKVVHGLDTAEVTNAHKARAGEVDAASCLCSLETRPDEQGCENLVKCCLGTHQLKIYCLELNIKC